MGFDVNGCIALVTGANRGIGKTIVGTLVQRGAKKVYAAVRKLESAELLIAEFGTKVVPLRVDVNHADMVDAAAGIATDVTLVINNAGILRCASPLDEKAIESLQEEIETNVFGLIRIAQAFGPVLKANGGGAFVQLNSVASLRTFPMFSTYCASKAASHSLTQALGYQWADQNTQVLSVHPGPIDTDMAVEGGIQDIAEPPTLVSEGIVTALAAGDFHMFPDSYATEVGDAYASFAAAHVIPES